MNSSFRTAVLGLCLGMSIDSLAQIHNGLLPVTYEYEKHDSVTKIYPVSEYLDALRRGSVRALPWRPCCTGYFAWQFPELSVKTSNTTQRSAYLREVVLTVSKSDVNFEPVLIFETDFEGRITLHNEGWGPVVDPKVNFTLSVADCSLEGITMHRIPRFRVQIPAEAPRYRK